MVAVVDIIYFGFCFGGKMKRKKKFNLNKAKQNETKHHRYHLVCDNEINQIIFSEVEQRHGVNANIDLIHHWALSNRKGCLLQTPN